MSSSRDKLFTALAERRTPEGGYAALAGGAASTESTALAWLALAAYGRAEATETRAAEDWLARRQLPEGAWPLGDGVPEPSWASAWALLALAEARADTGVLERGGAWLVAREGVRPSWLARTLGRLSGQRRRIEHDLGLRGWPWHPAAASWIEPTATAVLALRRLGASAGARARIEEGERLLWNRMCVGGGWNYGNRRVLGEEIPPYPDTTALALVALQGAERPEDLDASFAALDAMLAARASSLALALAALAHALHGRDSEPLRAALARRLERRGPPAETRALAFALLALAERGAERLRVPA